MSQATGSGFYSVSPCFSDHFVIIRRPVRLAWVGWLFAPHLLVATLSLPFWHSPVLVVIAGMMAFVGTGGEGRTVRR